MATQVLTAEQFNLASEKLNIHADVSAISTPDSELSENEVEVEAIKSQPVIQQKEHNGGYGTLIDTNGDEFVVPNISFKSVRDAIPRECFERSAAKGLFYVTRDYAMIAAAWWVASTYITPELIPSTPLRYLLWNTYGFFCGLVGFGLFSYAHDCSHQAFSPWRQLDDAVGYICHTSMLVPYFAWQIGHRQHHQGTNHMQKDMGFTPRTKLEYATFLGTTSEGLHEAIEDSPIGTLAYVVTRQLIGFPFYLLTNDTSHGYGEEAGENMGKGPLHSFLNGINHFYPHSPIFNGKDAHKVIYSDIGILAMVSLIAMGIRTYGWSTIGAWYFLPYLWTNHWFMLITYIQHTDPRIPHYDESAWTFARGALSTVDRDFGWIGRFFFHDAPDNHVLHHFASRIPLYNARKATAAIKEVLGPHYFRQDRGGILGCFWDAFEFTRTCEWVQPSEDATDKGKGIFFFRNRGMNKSQAAAKKVE